MTPFVLDERPTYAVETELGPGMRVNVYRGHDREEAHRIANFWDERVNTYITEERPPRELSAYLNWRFDQLQKWIRVAG